MRGVCLLLALSRMGAPGVAALSSSLLCLCTLEALFCGPVLKTAYVLLCMCLFSVFTVIVTVRSCLCLCLGLKCFLAWFVLLFGSFSWDDLFSAIS